MLTYPAALNRFFTPASKQARRSYAENPASSLKKTSKQAPNTDGRLLRDRMTTLLPYQTTQLKDEIGPCEKSRLITDFYQNEHFLITAKCSESRIVPGDSLADP